MMHANPDAEQYVLGCILMDDTLLRETELHPDHFFIGRHQDMFRKMREMSKKGERVDFLSMAVHDAETAKALSQAFPSITLFRHYEKLVMEAWKKRKAVEITDEMKRELADTGDSSFITSAIRDLTKLEETGVQTDYNFRDRVLEVLDEIKADTGEMKGIPTGFRDLNTMLHGWHDQDLIIIGARPSVGKTAFVLHTLRHAAELGVVVTLFALEMEDKANIRRMLSSKADVDATKMRAPKKFFNKADWDNISREGSLLSELKIAIYDKPNVSTTEIRTKIRAVKNRYPNDKHMVVIDYLQLMRGSNPRDKKVDQMGEISRDLKLLAREFNLPVIALSQLSRGVESRQDKRPMMSDLRDSGNIEQDADVIMLLYRDDYYNKEEPSNIVEVNISKQRNGKTGLVQLVFLKERNKFADLERHPQ